MYVWWKTTAKWMLIAIVWYPLNKLKYLLQNCFVKYGSQIFLQAIGFPVGSDLCPFFADLCLFHYESECIVKMKNIDHHQARTFGHVYRFIDVLNFINDNDF